MFERKIKNVDANYPRRENLLKQVLKNTKGKFADILDFRNFSDFSIFSLSCEEKLKLI